MGNEIHPFDEMLQRPESDIRLAHASLLWARDEYDEIAPARYLDRLNGLAERVDAEGAYSAADRVEAMRSVIVESESYRGNVQDYFNPANSYLNRVIDTRLGIPITLSTIWLDVARQLDWPLHGLNLPGHFLVRYDGIDGDLIVDPFNQGRVLTRESCTKMVQAMFGEEFVLKEEHFLPVGPRSILARMLGNIYIIRSNACDWPRTTHALERLVAINTEDPMMGAELGRVQTLTGELRKAAVTLNRALKLADTDEERATVNHHLVDLRHRLSEQN